MKAKLVERAKQAFFIIGLMMFCAVIVGFLYPQSPRLDCCAECIDYCECVATCDGWLCVPLEMCGLGVSGCRGVGSKCCLCLPNP